MITYIVKMVLCSAIVFSLYHLFLEKEKMHRFNRFYLLMGMVLSFVIPLATFKTTVPMPSHVWQQEVRVERQPLGSSAAVLEGSSIQPTTSHVDYLSLIYITGSCVFLIRMGINLLLIARAIKSANVIPYGEAKLLLNDTHSASYSFLSYIFIDRVAYETGKLSPEILRHELSHVRQKHSFDILFAELLMAFAWFNPVFYFFKKAIVLNHEFLADDEVLEEFSDTQRYQNLLLETISKGSAIGFSSQFNYSITRKRLIMMTRKSKAITMALKKVSVLPVLAGCVLIFSTNVSEGNAAMAAGTVEHALPVVAGRATVSYARQETPELLQSEYDKIINGYKTESVNGWKTFLGSVSKADRQRLAAIYAQMKPDQQEKQGVVFVDAPKPFKKVPITPAQLKSWGRGTVYGVWIDGKRVSNDALGNYSSKDFSHQFVSKLTKNAINYGKHYYQVDLMTNAYYDKYNAELKANKEKMMLVNQNFGR